MARSFDILAYDHIKVALQDVSPFEKVLKLFGFQKINKIPPHLKNPDSVWGSGEAFFCLYSNTHPEAHFHHKLHGDTVFDLSFLVKSYENHAMLFEGAGKMKHTLVHERSFEAVPKPRGILRFDHNTINVAQGELNPTVDFYLNTFGFEKGQYFDIKGNKTGLYSWVTRTKNKKVQIPFNEAQDPKSQIQEYIEMHRGPGVQHIALLTPDIIQTINTIRMEANGIVQFLDTPDTYYELVRQRIKVRESLNELKQLRILVDQDKQGGYLLQIFTTNLFSGVFFEIIQREGNEGFGEGNFQALFEAIELDQKRRGVL